MSLRRTALARKSELRRGGELRLTAIARKKATGAKRVQAAGRRRDTGPSEAVRDLVLGRAAGCCELCGTLLHDGYDWVEVHSFHHRQARGMGGTNRAEANHPSNLMLLCGTGTTGCHGFITHHPTSAEAEGWIVRHGLAPADVPVTLRAAYAANRRLCEPYAATRRVLLNDDGNYREVAA